MGNHCIDCAFCGQDQRIVGTKCCKAYVESEAKKEAEYRARVDADTAYLKRFGLETQTNSLGYCTKLDADDVVKVLKELEDGSRRIDGKGVLLRTSRGSRV